MPQAPRDALRAVIVGGSLGGLTAALYLRDLGADVQVFERSSVPLEGLGAGIVLHPSTVRYFSTNDALDVDRVSTRAEWLRYVDRDGRILHEERCHYRFTSYYSLYQGLLSCFDEDRYHLATEVVGFERAEDEVSVMLATGQRVESDLVVCADGIRSTARAKLLPDAVSAYAGYVGWRGTASRDSISSRAYERLDEAITYYVGSHSHILVYPIPDLDGSVAPGRRRLNFVWYLNVEEGDDLEDLMMDRDGIRRPISLPPGAVRDVHLHRLWENALSTLPEMLAETVVRSREPFVQAVFDIEVSRMSFGRICLIGDAAFAIRPHAAAGTAKAAEDAWRLATAIREAGGDIPSALRRWEEGQLALGRLVLARARDIGVRSQFTGGYRPGDPYLAFGLYEPSDSWMSDPGPA